jgi:hypothetical protein
MPRHPAAAHAGAGGSRAASWRCAGLRSRPNWERSGEGTESIQRLLQRLADTPLRLSRHHACPGCVVGRPSSPPAPANPPTPRPTCSMSPLTSDSEKDLGMVSSRRARSWWQYSNTRKTLRGRREQHALRRGPPPPKLWPLPRQQAAGRMAATRATGAACMGITGSLPAPPVWLGAGDNLLELHYVRVPAALQDAYLSQRRDGHAIPRDVEADLLERDDLAGPQVAGLVCEGSSSRGRRRPPGCAQGAVL